MLKDSQTVTGLQHEKFENVEGAAARKSHVENVNIPSRLMSITESYLPLLEKSLFLIDGKYRLQSRFGFGSFCKSKAVVLYLSYLIHE